MKRKKIVIVLLILAVIYWLPFTVTLLENKSDIASSINQLPNSDVAIIFGTLIGKSEEVSPLLKERLEAGKAILASGKSKKIVVSNTKDATDVMANYLYNVGISPNLIEIDRQAEKTPDTCAYEKKEYPEKRKVIFVSQGFHLPRLLYQCKKLGVEGIAFSAEALNTTDRPVYSLLTKLLIRTSRYIREAGLTWLAFLNIY